eukprot:531685-Alexandrium_andersonii.AAC.1
MLPGGRSWPHPRPPQIRPGSLPPPRKERCWPIVVAASQNFYPAPLVLALRVPRPHPGDAQRAPALASRAGPSHRSACAAAPRGWAR